MKPPEFPYETAQEDDINILEPDEVKVQEDQLLTEREECLGMFGESVVFGEREEVGSGPVRWFQIWVGNGWKVRGVFLAVIVMMLF